jgi:hypothetical protein
MHNQPAVARRQNWRRLRFRALAASAVLAAAVGAAMIPASSAGADVASGEFYLTNNPTGLCMDVAGGVAVPGAMVRSWTCNYSSAQNWYYDYSYSTVRFSADDDYCLDIWQGGTSEGTPVDLWPCTNAANQLWTFFELPDGTLLLQNPATGLCLNVPGQNPNEGQQLWLWNCYPDPMQSWNIHYF